ncbi:MAG TPA: hypothetical protein VKH35_10465 [Thermoanaerobaculia bacterium]|jgi:hypothetical protein|nr:hypothetical protein [Thermoanaerobaculia bacterium]
MPRKLFIALLFVVTIGAGFVAGRVSAAQPHMVNALNHLRAAQKQLDIAETDKGGHRVKALQLVRDAIAEVQLGIDAGRR